MVKTLLLVPRSLVCVIAAQLPLLALCSGLRASACVRLRCQVAFAVHLQYFIWTWCLQNELDRKAPERQNKSGVCLEYLKGTCNKGDGCPFSHSLRDAYEYVCKRKPHARIAQQNVSQNLLAALVAEQPGAVQGASAAEQCKRSYVLRTLIPTLVPGDAKRGEAIIACLVRIWPYVACIQLPACL